MELDEKFLTGSSKVKKKDPDSPRSENSEDTEAKDEAASTCQGDS